MVTTPTAARTKRNNNNNNDVSFSFSSFSSPRSSSSSPSSSGVVGLERRRTASTSSSCSSARGGSTTLTLKSPKNSSKSLPSPNKNSQTLQKTTTSSLSLLSSSTAPTRLSSPRATLTLKKNNQTKSSSNNTHPSSSSSPRSRRRKSSAAALSIAPPLNRETCVTTTTSQTCTTPTRLTPKKSSIHLSSSSSTNNNTNTTSVSQVAKSALSNSFKHLPLSPSSSSSTSALTSVATSFFLPTTKVMKRLTISVSQTAANALPSHRKRLASSSSSSTTAPPSLTPAITASSSSTSSSVVSVASNSNNNNTSPSSIIGPIEHSTSPSTSSRKSAPAPLLTSDHHPTTTNDNNASFKKKKNDKSKVGTPPQPILSPSSSSFNTLQSQTQSQSQLPTSAEKVKRGGGMTRSYMLRMNNSQQKRRTTSTPSTTTTGKSQASSTTTKKKSNVVKKVKRKGLMMGSVVRSSSTPSTTEKQQSQLQKEERVVVPSPILSSRFKQEEEEEEDSVFIFDLVDNVNHYHHHLSFEEQEEEEEEEEKLFGEFEQAVKKEQVKDKEALKELLEDFTCWEMEMKEYEEDFFMRNVDQFYQSILQGTNLSMQQIESLAKNPPPLLLLNNNNTSCCEEKENNNNLSSKENEEDDDKKEDDPTTTTLSANNNNNNTSQYNKTIQTLHTALTSLLTTHTSFLKTTYDHSKTQQVRIGKHLKQACALQTNRAHLHARVSTQINTLQKNVQTKCHQVIQNKMRIVQERESELVEELSSMSEAMAEAERIKTEALIDLEVVKEKEKKSVREIEKLKKIIHQHKSASPTSTSSSSSHYSISPSSSPSSPSSSSDQEELQKAKLQIQQLKSQLTSTQSQLTAAQQETKSASTKAESKDKDMSELMKSLGEIQRLGAARETEANNLRKDAEIKVVTLEKDLAKVTGELTVEKHDGVMIKEQMEQCKLDLKDAEEHLQELRAQVETYKNEISSTCLELKLEKELRKRCEQKENQERTERVAISAQMMAMTKEHARMEAQLAEANETIELKFNETLEKTRALLEEKEGELSQAREIIAGLEVEIEALKQALNDQRGRVEAKHAEEMSRLKGEIGAVRKRLKLEEMRFVCEEGKHLEKVKELEEEIREGQSERRRLHNLIQELRGNVRVFARIRPFLPEDNADDDARPCIVQKSDKDLKLRMGGDEPWQHNFTFDAVFPPSAGQEAVFNEASEFIQSALDGYNVCLFSYGQTGSGKTHTMQGSGVEQMRGIIPRAIEQVGKCKLKLEKDGWEHTMRVSFLEIYNESIRDLLREEGCEEVKHDIKVTKDGKRFVSNLTMKPIDPNDTDAVESIMRQAAMCRSVASTDMNSVSSRSHAVFTLHLTAVHPEQGQKLRGQLNLVDLAGSERLGRSGVDGDRAKESVAINKSLSSLTDVFVAIGRKGGHVPYRNSKLTYLLQPCLSGDGKTLMLVNLSPTDESSQESLCSLRFASQVNKCELGNPKRSIEDNVAADDDAVSVGSTSSSISTRRSAATSSYTTPKRRTTSSVASSTRASATSASRNLQRKSTSFRSRTSSVMDDDASVGSQRSAASTRSTKSTRSTTSNRSVTARTSTANSRHASKMVSPRQYSTTGGSSMNRSTPSTLRTRTSNIGKGMPASQS